MQVAWTLLALLPLAGCISIESRRQRAEIQTLSESVELGGAEMVRVEVSLPLGELRIEDGASKLLEANFRYTFPFARPVVRYTATGFRGHLTVDQGGENTLSLSNDVKNEWLLQLGAGVPIDLNVRTGAGENHLKLGALTLRRVEAHVGAGEVVMDLRGEPQRDYDVEIRGGVGEATVWLPRDVGVVAEARGGIGEIHVRGLTRTKDGNYVNAHYGKSRVTVRVDVRGGVGEINLNGE